MSAEAYKRLKRKVRDLCILIQSLGAEQTTASLSDLMQWGPEAMVDYMKHLIEALRQTYSNSNGFKGYQGALQKLEAEVRSHIQVRSK
jgi:hypothetical protein